MHLLGLNNVHRHIMRLLVRGRPLDLICEEEGPNLESWKQIVASPLFKAEMEKMQAQVDDITVAEAADDPVLAKLEEGSMKAANRLVAEIDNPDGEDSTASSSSRIKAATTVLGMARPSLVGNDRGKQEAARIVINISQSKVDYAEKKVHAA